MMQRSLNIIPDKCTGCKQCELACSLDNEGVFNPSKSRIQVFKFEDEGRFVPYTCTQCDEAWCARACPVDAITVDVATGAKVVSDSLCVGCKVCTIACPFGTINYNADTGKVIKCDAHARSHCPAGRRHVPGPRPAHTSAEDSPALPENRERR